MSDFARCGLLSNYRILRRSSVILLSEISDLLGENLYVFLLYLYEAADLPLWNLDCTDAIAAAKTATGWAFRAIETCRRIAIAARCPPIQVHR